jgi:hypothetical protein
VTKTYIACLMFLMLQAPRALAQSAMPTFNVVTRVLMVESQHGRGSIFSLDVDKREYWITAKHILTGAEHPPYGSVATRSESLRILDPGAAGERWLPITFSVIDTEKDVDIVVLAPPEPLLEDPLPSVVADSTGAFLGGDCEFLGFPYGGGWRATYASGKSSWMPFVKHCTISAMTYEGKRIWVLDGINNMGFSGGPVIFRTGPDQRIMAVVSGYLTEPTDVITSPPNKSARKSPQTIKPAAPPKQTVNLNSGFIISFDIAYAIDAIRKNPIGPLRKPK